MKSKDALIAAFVIVGVMALTGVATMNSVDAGIRQEALELISQYVTDAPEVDGIAEPMWDEVDAIEISTFGGANAGTHEVSLKSVYTDDKVHFLVQWTDPTLSQQRFPWVKQDDGSWVQMTDGSDHDEIVFYEDKFAFIWNVDNSIAGFNDTGCFVTCHVGEGDKPYGNKYTQTAGEIGDIWHWKSVRTNPVDYVDDQYLDDARWSADNSGAGRHSDPREGGSYVNNVNDEGTTPAFMGPEGANGPYWIVDSEKMEFADTFAAGDEIPGIIVDRATGDRGDLVGKGAYADGVWTLEISRELDTGSEVDVQFDNLTEPYFFGVAVFDNAQVRHAFQNGVSKLVFGDRPTAANTVTWGRIKRDIAK